MVIPKVCLSTGLARFPREWGALAFSKTDYLLVAVLVSVGCGDGGGNVSITSWMHSMD